MDRLLIDGVVDVQNWYLGMPYVFLHRGGIDHTAQGAVGDADKALQVFFDSCYAAGPTRSLRRLRIFRACTALSSLLPFLSTTLLLVPMRSLILPC